jgi:hypothetical protein
MRRQAVGVDNGCDRIRRVVKAVHELEPEGDQQSDPQQHERANGNRWRIGHVDIADQAIQDIANAHGQQNREDDHPGGVRLAIKTGTRGKRVGNSV